MSVKSRSLESHEKMTRYSLTEAQKQAWDLRMRGFSYKEIGKLLSISPTSARLRHLNARRSKIRELNSFVNEILKCGTLEEIAAEFAYHDRRLQRIKRIKPDKVIENLRTRKVTFIPFPIGYPFDGDGVSITFVGSLAVVCHPDFPPYVYKNGAWEKIEYK